MAPFTRIKCSFEWKKKNVRLCPEKKKKCSGGRAGQEGIVGVFGSGPPQK